MAAETSAEYFSQPSLILEGKVRAISGAFELVLGFLARLPLF